jgi:hypothetical protein
LPEPSPLDEIVAVASQQMIFQKRIALHLPPLIL